MPADRPAPVPAHVEHVEMSGHIVDSLLLPKVLDAILSRGGKYHIDSFKLGEQQDDPSFARIEVRADTAEQFERILAEIHPHGAVTAHAADCQTVAADMDGAFPEGFYSTTNFRTQVRLGGEWIDVEDQEMDCGILVDPEGAAARCVPMTGGPKGRPHRRRPARALRVLPGRDRDAPARTCSSSWPARCRARSPRA